MESCQAPQVGGQKDKTRARDGDVTYRKVALNIKSVPEDWGELELTSRTNCYANIRGSQSLRRRDNQRLDGH